MSSASRGAVAGSGAFRGLGRSIAFASGTFLGTAGLVTTLKASVSAASDTVEQINKANVVFRQSGKEVVAWSATMIDRFGLAQDHALAFAATFGNMLVPMGFARKAAGDMSQRLVELAVDMASFNNASIEDTLLAIQSGIAGQVRPLRQYGVFLSEARIQAEALSSGIVTAKRSTDEIATAQTKAAIAQARLTEARKKYGEGTTQVAQAQLGVQAAEKGLEKALQGHTTQLTQAQKAEAIYRIILKDTADAQGDYSRTSDQLANQQRQLSERIHETEASIGKALMPTILNVTQRMNEWLSKSENQEKIQRGVTAAVHDLTAALKIVVPLVQGIANGANDVAKALGGWKQTLELLIALKMLSWTSRLAGGFLTLAGPGGIGAANAAAGPQGLLGNLRLLTSRAWVVSLSVVVAKGLGEALRKAGLRLPGTTPSTGSGTIPGTYDLGGGTEVFLVGGDRGGNNLWYDPKEKLFYNSGSDGTPQASIGKGEAKRLLGVKTDGQLSSALAVAMGKYRAAKKQQTAAAQGAAAQTPSKAVFGQNVLPSGITGDHPTANLPGFPAIDVFRDPGTVIGSPVNGVVTRLSGRPWSAGWSNGPGSAIGLSIYIHADNGDDYFLTHFDQVFVKAGQAVNRGTPLGTVGPMQGRAPHIHEGRHAAGALTVGSAAAAASITDVPPTLRTAVAKASVTPKLADDIAAQQDVLSLYLKRLKRKGLTANERADLQEAIAATKLRIQDLRKGLLTVGSAAAAASITDVPPALRIAIARAEATPRLADDLVAQHGLLALYLKRLKRKGLTADERADLEEAKSSTIQKLQGINKEIAAKAAEDAKKYRTRTKLIDQLMESLGLPTSAMAIQTADIIRQSYAKISTATLKARVKAMGDMKGIPVAYADICDYCAEMCPGQSAAKTASAGPSTTSGGGPSKPSRTADAARDHGDAVRAQQRYAREQATREAALRESKNHTRTLQSIDGKLSGPGHARDRNAIHTALDAAKHLVW